jgi:hypothetical protein
MIDWAQKVNLRQDGSVTYFSTMVIDKINLEEDKNLQG